MDALSSQQNKDIVFDQEPTGSSIVSTTKRKKSSFTGLNTEEKLIEKAFYWMMIYLRNFSACRIRCFFLLCLLWEFA
jgi:hypothetical protein